MNSKFLSRVTILGMAFALVFALGSLNVAKAVPGENGDSYNLRPGQSDQFGIDEAHNWTGVINSDADRGAVAVQAQYGLGMQSQQ